MTHEADVLPAFDAAAAQARSWLAALPQHRTAVTDTARLSEVMPDSPTDPAGTVAQLAEELAVGIMPSAGPRYFGFVTGGTLPAALGAEVLTAAWDQNTALAVMSPALAELEDVTGRWIIELLGLPPALSYGFVTGATMANWTALAAARRYVLTQVGWDLDEDGLAGGPPITVLAGAERHSSIDVALRYLGIGRRRLRIVGVDDQGRIDPEDLKRGLAEVAGPAIVCAQAGNVNTGAIDPMADICRTAHAVGAWVHIDAAVGAWLAASPRHRDQLQGWEQADSWALDAHKGLNTAYDSGIVLTAHPGHHTEVCRATAPYLPASTDRRDGSAWTPEGSRRARALGVHAALRQLGRSGVADLVTRQCDLAQRFAVALADMPGAQVCNQVTSNQVLVRFGADDATTDEVIRRIQAGGVCWMGGTRRAGVAMMRISVCNWMTGEADVDMSLAEIERCLALSVDR